MAPQPRCSFARTRAVAGGSRFWSGSRPAPGIERRSGRQTEAPLALRFIGSRRSPSRGKSLAANRPGTGRSARPVGAPGLSGAELVVAASPGWPSGGGRRVVAVRRPALATGPVGLAIAEPDLGVRRGRFAAVAWPPGRCPTTPASAVPARGPLRERRQREEGPGLAHDHLVLLTRWPWAWRWPAVGTRDPDGAAAWWGRTVAERGSGDWRDPQHLPPTASPGGSPPAPPPADHALAVGSPGTPRVG